jgi:phosphoribosylanthranilate isomerase
MTVVKICGITTLEDALAAVEAGAELLGFNFYPPSPRAVSPEICARITSSLRARGVQVGLVGVFVNMPVEGILNTLDRCGLDLAQCSGDETSFALAALGNRGYKAVRPRSLEEAREAMQAYPRAGPPPALLADAWKPGEFGGTGATGNWDVARELASQIPLLLAGGLHPGNVGEAVAQVRPWGVDVASGVELIPGRKDAQKMAAFVQAIK